MSYTLDEIADKIGASVVYTEQKNDVPCYINSVTTLANAKSGQIAFLANSKYRQQLTATQASAVIISPDCVTD